LAIKKISFIPKSITTFKNQLSELKIKSPRKIAWHLVLIMLIDKMGMWLKDLKRQVDAGQHYLIAETSLKIE